MAPPTGPYVNIQSGFTSGTIAAGQPFSWYNSGAGNCTVSNVGTWCTASSYGPITGGQSMSATVKTGIPTNNYNFTSPCNQGNAVVHVVGTHPDPTKESKTKSKKKRR
jgi:hypothetical protein